jgi:hypothetical protein
MQPPEMATTVRVQDGKTLTTDGPFVAINGRALELAHSDAERRFLERRLAALND